MTWINYDLFCCFFDVNVRNGYFQKGSRQVDEVGGISLPVKFKSDAVFFPTRQCAPSGLFLASSQSYGRTDPLAKPPPQKARKCRDGFSVISRRLFILFFGIMFLLS